MRRTHQVKEQLRRRKRQQRRAGRAPHPLHYTDCNFKTPQPKEHHDRQA